jgi:hypothetical protein
LTIEIGTGRSSFIKNFPFPQFRERQATVLDEMDSAFSSGYKYIILEAPTGFGKSPVAMAAALALGSSFICTSTKDLQSQYTRDFPFVRAAKGKSNFLCEVKDDFIRDAAYLRLHPPRTLAEEPSRSQPKSLSPIPVFPDLTTSAADIQNPNRRIKPVNDKPIVLLWSEDRSASLYHFSNNNETTMSV